MIPEGRRRAIEKKVHSLPFRCTYRTPMYQFQRRRLNFREWSLVNGARSIHEQSPCYWPHRIAVVEVGTVRLGMDESNLRAKLSSDPVTVDAYPPYHKWHRRPLYGKCEILEGKYPIGERARRKGQSEKTLTDGFHLRETIGETTCIEVTVHWANR